MTREELINGIIGFIRSRKEPARINEISKFLQIPSHSGEYEILKDILRDLCDNQVLEYLSRRRYTLKGNTPDSSIKGVIHIQNDRGVIRTDHPDLSKIIIPQKHLNTALEGDTVHVRLHAIKKGKKPRGEVLEVIKRNKTKILGTVDHNGYVYFLIPDEEAYYVDFLIPDSKLAGASKGDKVEARFLEWTDPLISPHAEVVEIIGKAGVPRVEFVSVIHEFELPTEFPDDVIEEANSFKAPINRKAKSRLDLRDDLIITIDPFDAKDFDDALSLKTLENGNWLLGVHIADVSHYVKENSALDIEARFRGNSVYLVDRVIPMLPEKLSNDICSLKPGVPRYAYSVFMEFSPRGTLKSYEVAESLILSKRRYTYEEALDIILKEEGDNAELLLNLDQLAQVLRRKRFRSGGIEFENNEIRFKLDENKYPVEAYLKTSTRSTSLVEECMLVANQTVAGHVRELSKKYKLHANLPFLYRIHEEPEPKKINEVMKFISSISNIQTKKSPTSKEINDMLKHFEDRPDKYAINQIMIRSMAKAIYSERNVGHYGLGFKEYSHFTSPIRRYPDLVIHRLLKEYGNDLPKSDRLSFLKMFVRDVGTHTTNTERIAMEAERASVKLTSAVLASKYVGSNFDGTINGITSFGVFVQMEGIWAEGLLHMRNLDDDYYYFDEPNFRIVGKRTKKVLAFGMKVRVKIIKVNIDKRTIDLALAKDFSDR